MSSFNNKERFTSKADLYDKYRPLYPNIKMLDLLKSNLGLSNKYIIADIRGKSSKFCKNGIDCSFLT